MAAVPASMPTPYEAAMAPAAVVRCPTVRICGGSPRQYGSAGSPRATAAAASARRRFRSSSDINSAATRHESISRGSRGRGGRARSARTGSSPR
jgi:hypothetical protein